LKKLAIPLVVILILAILVVSCSSTPSTSPAAGSAAKTLTIGEIEPLTGMFGEIFKYVPQGEQLAKEYINNNGGVTVNGQKYNIDIVTLDGKDSPDGATAAATELVLDKKVKFIAGTGPAFMVPAIDAVTEPNGVLYTAVYQNGQKVEMGPKYPLKFVGSNCSFSGQLAAMNYVKQKYPDIKSIAYILVNDGQIADNDPAVRATATKLGLSIKGDIVGFTPDTQDFTPIAQKAIAANADAIMIGNAITPWFALSIKSIRALGYTKPVFSCCAAFVLPDVLGIAGKDAEGFFGPSIPSDPNVPGLPQIGQDVVKMANSKGWTMNMMHVQGFSAVYSMVQAIQNAQSLDPKTVAAKWEQMSSINTIFGPGKMSGKQTYGVDHNVYFQTPISIVKNGKVEFGGWVPLDQAIIP
jgi:branched-chain amino acid transport system substrate-binding protein